MKYDKLKIYLKGSEQERIQLTFTEIESILSFSLPNSAKQYRAWWPNGGQSHSNIWMDVGYKVDEVSFTRQYVVFIRAGLLKNKTAENTRKEDTTIEDTTVEKKQEAAHRITNDVITI